HTNAGSYTDTWMFHDPNGDYQDASGTVTDTINKASAVIVVRPYKVIYDGRTHTATVKSITGVNGETGATVGSVDVSNTTHTNAGTYAKDSWSFPGTANYKSIARTIIIDTIKRTIAVPVAQTVYEDVDTTISGISIGDGPSASLTVKLTVRHGTLKLPMTS